jgi:hypothetical protein
MVNSVHVNLVVHVACSMIIFFTQVNNATPRPKRGPMSAQSNRGSFHGTACCSKDVPSLHVQALHVACCARNV